VGNTPQQGGFYSTPAFEIFRRGLIVQTVKRFRGLNSYLPLTQLTPDVASDLLNVIVTSSGQLAKMRLPVPLSSVVGGQHAGPYSFWDFQQGNGVRQVLAHFGEQVFSFDPAFAAGTLIETNLLNLNPWSFVEANNILFGANGTRMQKWTGTAWQPWGIVAPTTAASTIEILLPAALAITAITNNQGGGVAFITLATALATPYFGIPPFTNVNITIAGNTNANFNGTFVFQGYVNNTPPPATRAVTFFITLAAGNNGTGGTVRLASSPTVGWSWAYAYKNSVTGHVSNISPTTGALIPSASNGIQLAANPPGDSQVDTLVWFRTLDGGGDYFYECDVNLVTGAVTQNGLAIGPMTSVAVGGQFTTLNDNNTPDTSLDQTKRGPLINNPPPQGLYTALAQGRVFVAGLIGAQQDVAYSGYEQILLGRPEESFPQFNRLRLSLGAEAVAGLGVLHSGVVMFSSTGKMWMLRGAIEDITLSAPVAFSEFLEELPWTLGCLSHYTIQETPYGLVWLAGDKTVQFWDGKSNPIDISQPVYPLLRSITPGTEKLCNARYFNWLERDWYALTCATNGASAPNTIIFFSMEKDSQQIDVFVSNIQADWIGGQSTPTLQRRLLISHGGIISELPVRATDQGGLTNDFTTYPPTSGNLRAYWRSGYFGNDQPEQSKMWRWARMVADGGVTSYQMQSRYVDDSNLIQAPRIVGPIPVKAMRTPLNQRAYRASVEIDFPEVDAPMNVLELQVSYIGTSQR
jgi:hypothetical protein